MTDPIIEPEETFTIIPERLEKLLKGEVFLHPEGHSSFDDGHCAMEVVSWLAGLGFTDTPRCASRVLGDAVISYNDYTNDEDRQLLVPILPLTVGTRNDGKDPARRYIGADHLLRVAFPLVLEFTGRTEQATMLRELPVITRDGGWGPAIELAEALTSEVEQASRDWLKTHDVEDPRRWYADSLAQRVTMSSAFSALASLGGFIGWTQAYGESIYFDNLAWKLLSLHVRATEPDLQDPSKRTNYSYTEYDRLKDADIDRLFGDLPEKFRDAALAMLTAAVNPE